MSVWVTVIAAGGRVGKFTVAVAVEEIEVGVLPVPDDPADKGPDGGPLLLHTVAVDALPYGGKHLADHVKLNAGHVLLLQDAFQFGQPLFQSFAGLMQLLDLRKDVLLRTGPLRFSQGEDKPLDGFLVFVDLSLDLGQIGRASCRERV